jgi:hypothetical protein
MPYLPLQVPHTQQHMEKEIQVQTVVMVMVKMNKSVINR